MQSHFGETLWSFCVHKAMEETGFLEELLSETEYKCKNDQPCFIHSLAINSLS